MKKIENFKDKSQSCHRCNSVQKFSSNPWETFVLCIHRVRLWNFWWRRAAERLTAKQRFQRLQVFGRYWSSCSTSEERTWRITSLSIETSEMPYSRSKPHALGVKITPTDWGQNWNEPILPNPNTKRWEGQDDLLEICLLL